MKSLFANVFVIQCLVLINPRNYTFKQFTLGITNTSRLTARHAVIPAGFCRPVLMLPHPDAATDATAASPAAGPAGGFIWPRKRSFHPISEPN